MKCLRALVVLIFLISSLIGINCGDDKSANNPANDIPASLVGTWWYHSGTQDGVPIGLFAEINFTDTSEAGSTTSNANATWSGAEFYDNQVVFTQSGTFTVNNDILKITRVIFNDDPADPNDTSWRFGA